MKDLAQNRKVIGIIQARMGSSRLPGKTLADISGKPFLQHVIERALPSKYISQMIVATTTGAEDQVIEDLALKCGCKAYRGSSNDVLDRYYQAALPEKPDIVVRICADDPIKDPEVSDKIIEALLTDPNLDYASNTLKPTFPEGLDIEAFTFNALSRAWHEAKLPSEREHVTPYIWKHPEKFKLLNITNPVDLSHLRWTLDYEEDLTFTRAVYARLYRPNKIFLTEEIVELLRREPEISQINSRFQRNAGYAASIANENNQ